MNARPLPCEGSALPLSYSPIVREKWSGKRDSNPRPTAWKAIALPTELFPPATQSILSPMCRIVKQNIYICASCLFCTFSSRMSSGLTCRTEIIFSCCDGKRRFFYKGRIVIEIKKMGEASAGGVSHLAVFYSSNLSSNISTIVFSVPTMPGEAISPMCFIVNSGFFPLIPWTLKI